MIENDELLQKILSTLTRISSLDKKRSLIHGELALTSTEVHLLMFLRYVQQTNITEIAETMGITKGAVSRTLSSLERKGIITKERNTKRKNELHIEFSEKGKKLMQLIQTNLDTRVIGYISKLTKNQRETVSEFLDVLISIAH
jgi:MarR family transcriptional regulator, teicoplanin-associated locus regulator